MRVLLVSNYACDRQQSMLRFAAALHSGLQAMGVDVELVRPEPFFGRLRPGASGVGKWLGYLDKFLLFPPRLWWLARSFDVVHICDHSNAVYVPVIASHPHLVTCNDLLAVRSARGEFSQNRTGWTGRLLQSWILAGLRRAQRLTCISEATRRDLLRLAGHAPERLSVTYMGQNFAYAPIAEVAEAAEARRCGKSYDAEVFARYGLPDEPYLLHIGGGQWYKNRAGVVAMHAALRGRKLRLVLVGPGSASAGVEVRVDVGNEGLSALYSGAELLLFPSLAEGFGWPIVEAQACGCRVVTTGQPPMTEVGGDAAGYIADPSDALAGAACIETVLAQDAETRRHMVEAGLANAARFSTERMMREYLALYRELTGL